MALEKLFIFGLGFSAQEVAKALLRQEPLAQIAATSRQEKSLAADGLDRVAMHIFDGERPGATLLPDLTEATHLLISIAPNTQGDPVLNAHIDHILAAPKLEWIGYFSTIGVYGDADGDWIDEHFATQPTSDRLQWRLEAEAQWSDLAQKRGTPLAILRLAGIYGPGRSAFDKLRAGKAHRIVKKDQVFNRIFAPDIGAITLKAAQHRLSGLYNLCDLEPAPPQDVIAHAAGLLGIEAPPAIDFETADLSPMARSFYASNRRVSSARIRAALDYKLVAPTYREGLRAILEHENNRALHD